MELLAEAWTYARSLFDAQERYYMENGKFTENLDELDITLENMKNWEKGIDMYIAVQIRRPVCHCFLV